jgi:type II secretory pathway component PulJ
MIWFSIGKTSRGLDCSFLDHAPGAQSQNNRFQTEMSKKMDVVSTGTACSEEEDNNEEEEELMEDQDEQFYTAAEEHSVQEEASMFTESESDDDADMEEQQSIESNQFQQSFWCNEEQDRSVFWRDEEDSADDGDSEFDESSEDESVLYRKRNSSISKGSNSERDSNCENSGISSYSKRSDTMIETSNEVQAEGISLEEWKLCEEALEKEVLGRYVDWTDEQREACLKIVRLGHVDMNVLERRLDVQKKVEKRVHGQVGL